MSKMYSTYHQQQSQQESSSSPSASSPNTTTNNNQRRTFKSASVDVPIVNHQSKTSNNNQNNNHNTFLSSLVQDYLLSPVMTHLANTSSLMQPGPVSPTTGSYPPTAGVSSPSLPTTGAVQSPNIYELLYRSTKSLFGVAGMNFECAHHNNSASSGFGGQLSEESKKMLESLAAAASNHQSAQNLCAAGSTATNAFHHITGDHSSQQQQPNLLNKLFLLFMPSLPFGGVDSQGASGSSASSTAETLSKATEVTEGTKFSKLSSNSQPSPLAHEMASFPALYKSRSATSTPSHMFDKEATVDQMSSGFGGPASFGVATAAAAAAKSHLPELLLEHIGDLFGNLKLKRSDCDYRRSRSLSDMELSSSAHRSESIPCGERFDRVPTGMTERDLRYQRNHHMLNNNSVDSCGEDSVTEEDELDDVYPAVDILPSVVSSERRNSLPRRGSNCSNLDFGLWKHLFGNCAQEEVAKSENEASNRKKAAQKMVQQNGHMLTSVVAPEECALLQKDRQRKQERRRKNRRRRNRKKARSSSDSEESNKSDGSSKGDDSGDEVRPRKSPKCSTASKGPQMLDIHFDDDEDEEDDDLIAFVDHHESVGRRNSKSPKSPKAFRFDYDDEDEETESEHADDDDEWDEMDESEQSSDDHAEILDMLRLGGCGLSMTNLRTSGQRVGTATSTNCDNKMSNNYSTQMTSSNGGKVSSCATSIANSIPGLRAFIDGVCPLSGGRSNNLGLATTSSAVDIPASVDLYSNSPCSPFGSMSPDIYSQSPIEDEMARAAAAAADEEVQPLVEEANRKWADTLLQWKEEMGPERAALLDEDLNDVVDGEDEDDQEEGQSQLVVNAEDDIFDLEVEADDQDQPDHAIMMNHSSLRSKSAMTSPKASARDRRVRFVATPPKVFEVAKNEDCRSNYWYLAMVDRKRFEERLQEFERTLAPVFQPDHRDRIYRERFADAEDGDSEVQK